MPPPNHHRAPALSACFWDFTLEFIPYYQRFWLLIKCQYLGGCSNYLSLEWISNPFLECFMGQRRVKMELILGRISKISVIYLKILPNTTLGWNTSLWENDSINVDSVFTGESGWSRYFLKDGNTRHFGFLLTFC